MLRQSRWSVLVHQQIGRSSIQVICRHCIAITAIFLSVLSCNTGDRQTTELPTLAASYRVIAFYYPWWGNPDTDGDYIHWAHDIIGDTTGEGRYPGGKNIAAGFFPLLGCYSSNDSAVIDAHMRQLKHAGIGVISLSWWGVDSFEDETVPRILDIANQYGIKVCFHIEPVAGRTATTTRQAIVYITDRYASHPACFRDELRGNRPLFFIYDSYTIDAAEWASILAPNAANSIRGTRYDAVMVCLWVEPHEEDFIIEGCFDGFYTYFAAEGFTYGSTPANWSHLAAWANSNNKVFIPCVGPGYDDVRVRPWNDINRRERQDGEYYDRMFAAAVRANPSYIGITSFNEWHEGTQIEPAIPKSVDGFAYEDYSPEEPTFYLDRTRHWVELYEEAKAALPSIPENESDYHHPDINHLGIGAILKLAVPPGPRYDGGSDSALIDGLRGTENYRAGRWIGFEGDNLEAVVDLSSIVDISSVRLRTLVNSNAWILPPVMVEFAVSIDGQDYQLLGKVEPAALSGPSGPGIMEYSPGIDKVAARYVRVRAENAGVCPEWHPGAGGKAWLFVDELIIE